MRFRGIETRLTPGMIRAGSVMGTRSIDLFGISDLGLVGLAMEDGVVQSFALIEDRNVALGI